MIFLNNVTKQFGERTLFADVSLTIDRGEKIGLVGPNGAGKSTFFSLILGTMPVSFGTIQVNKNVRIGYLAQEASFDSGKTVLSEVTTGDEALSKILQEKKDLEQRNQADSFRYGEILQELEVLGFFTLEPKAKKVLTGLGFSERDFNRCIHELSGGWQMRVLLAKLLTFPYDILLLDEPTNYLDLNAALWLKDYLASFNGAFIMISHDRDFLDEVTNYTLVLEYGKMAKMKGNYEEYVKQRDQQREHLRKQFIEQEKKRKQLQRFIERFHAQPNKAAQVRSKKRQIERMDEIVVPPDPRESIRNFRFPATAESGYRVMALRKMSKAYGDIQVYKDFDFEIIKNEKAVLVGENGAGKSTLLKIMAGVVPLDSGQCILGHNVTVGYFSQTRLDVLNPYNTVLEEAFSVASQDLRADEVRTILAAFFFVGDDVNKKVTILSGGEKSRLILAKLLISPPNLLLLDEPTTHLDVDAVEALIKALHEYKGTLICISHDIHFVRSIANTVFEVHQGQVRKYPGNFDYYREKKAKGETSEPTPVLFRDDGKKIKVLKTRINHYQNKIEKSITNRLKRRSSVYARKGKH